MFIDSIYDKAKITVLFNNTKPLSIYGIIGIYGMYSNTILHPPQYPPVCSRRGGYDSMTYI